RPTRCFHAGSVLADLIRCGPHPIWHGISPNHSHLIAFFTKRLHEGGNYLRADHSPTRNTFTRLHTEAACPEPEECSSGKKPHHTPTPPCCSNLSPQKTTERFKILH